MIRYLYRKCLSDDQRSLVKTNYLKVKKRLVDRWRAYDANALVGRLRTLGIGAGDTLLVHSSYSPFSGFSGSPQEIINGFVQLVGESGNLIMVSMPYGCSSYEYLLKNPEFDVRKTPSRMGIISEVFRRRKGVRRSLHPTHPVLVLGKDAPWIVEGHENAQYPCGKETPFDKFRLLGGKVLFYDASFRTFTFLHYIEDDIKASLPFRLYRDTAQVASVIDYAGDRREVPTYTFSDVAVRTRDPLALMRAMDRRGKVSRSRVGNSHLMLVKAQDAVDVARDMARRREYFYTRPAAG